MTATVRDYTALMAFMASRARLPFAWGSNDCVSYAAGAVQAQTGRDLLAGLPSWSTEAEAQQVLEARGGLAEAVGAVLAEIHPSRAHRGDVAGVVYNAAGDLALMVVEGTCLVGPWGPDRPGVRRMPRAMMVRSWSADLPLPAGES